MNHLKTHQTNPTTAQYRPVQSNTSTAQYSQVQPIPEPDPKPELFGQTRPEPNPKSKSPTRQSLIIPAGSLENLFTRLTSSRRICSNFMAVKKTYHPFDMARFHMRHPWRHRNSSECVN